jgi:hypothetical protein
MWEYMFQPMGNATEDEVVVILNELAHQGWELVAYDFAEGKGLLKRKKVGLRAV